MGKVTKSFRLLIMLITFSILLFSAYNFGIIGQVYSGREQESQALSAEEPYALYFYSSSCLVSRAADEYKQALSEHLVDLAGLRWVDIDVEDEGELEFAWKKKVQVTPTMLFYASDGRLIGHYSGKIDWEVAETELVANFEQ
jgi:thioredoxin-related protein